MSGHRSESKDVPASARHTIQPVDDDGIERVLVADEEARAVAYAVLGRIENSGYGTTRPDRYTPMFGVDEVTILAEFVLWHFGRHSAEQDQ